LEMELEIDHTKLQLRQSAGHFGAEKEVNAWNKEQSRSMQNP